MNTAAPWTDKKLTKQERADMAFRYLDWLLIKNVPSGGFLLLYAILQRLNEENQFHCFPSIDYLAGCINRHPSTVWEMLPKLEKLGVIEIEWGSQGSRHPNTYRLPTEFLQLYFGPTKGRQPKPDPVPKKPGQASVSKPGQARVSNALKTRAQPQKKAGFTPGKPGPARESHFLATYSHQEQRSDAKSIDPSSETLADNWQPSSADRAFARSRRGWDDNQIDLVAEKFVLHFHAKLPTAKVADQWRKWVLNERDDPQASQGRKISGAII
jgi:hypothetical protein